LGEPVRIRDMARLMIELSGLSVLDDDNPDGDIAIEEIGLRPGEKLIEELLIDAASEGTVHPRIIKANERFIEWVQLEPLLRRFSEELGAADVPGVIDILKELVPEYSGNPPTILDRPAEPRPPHLRVVGEPARNS